MPGQSYGIGIEDNVSAYIVGDSASGQIFAQYQEEEVLPIASLTKIMTYMVVEDEIEKGNLSYEDTVEISKEAAETTGSSMDLKEGDTVTIEDLLEGMMIVSGNDASIVLAQKVSGSEDEFIKLMAAKADEIGLTTATFHTASGLPLSKPENTMSTKDLFTMSEYLIKNYPQVLDLTSQMELVQPERDFSKPSTIPFLPSVPGIDGLKTGTTADAGHCLITTKMGSGNQGDESFRTIGIIMGAPDKFLRDDCMRMLMEYVDKSFAVTTLTDPNQVYDEIPFAESQKGSIEVYPSEELKILINKERGVSYTPTYLDVSAPLKSGDKVGELLIKPGKEGEVTMDLIVKEDYGKADVGTRILRSGSNILTTIRKMLYF